MKRAAAILIALTLTVLSGCAAYKPYRTATAICQGTEADCPHAILYQHKARGQSAFDYTLGFVEFNDQGDTWTLPGPDPSAQRQTDLIVDYLNRQAGDQDLLMVVFVHGWHHSAKGPGPGDERADDNVETFQRVLQGLAQEEQQRASRSPARRSPRPVVGVYVGWRGESITLPGLNELTFWDRKNTAAQVGHGGVTQLLSRIELVKRTQDSKARANAGGPAAGSPCDDHGGARDSVSDTRLVVVGHSFGGLVVQSAVGQILEDRAVRTKGGDFGCQLGVEGFGNLVVLINPAFEAQRYSVLHDMAEKRRFYPPDQLPVEVILTSQADEATKVLFPLGRHVSTLFDRNGWDAQNVTAVGHYQPYITHTLSRKTATTRGRATLKQAWVDKNRVGSDICVAGLTLRRVQLSQWNPYLNISVSGELIKSHNDIDEPSIIEFIKQMIMLSAQTKADRNSPAAADDTQCNAML